MDLCDCDNKCLLYNTCCSDANITDTEVTGRMVESDCVTQDERVVNNNFYAITKCPTSYDQNAISQLCSTPINWQRAQPSKKLITIKPLVITQAFNRGIKVSLKSTSGQCLGIYSSAAF